MAKSVELLKRALESEQNSVKDYEEALKVMAHEESKKAIVGIIDSKKNHIESVKKILESSRQCPAIKD